MSKLVLEEFRRLAGLTSCPMASARLESAPVPTKKPMTEAPEELDPGELSDALMNEVDPYVTQVIRELGTSLHAAVTKAAMKWKRDSPMMKKYVVMNPHKGGFELDQRDLAQMIVRGLAAEDEQRFDVSGHDHLKVTFDI